MNVDLRLGDCLTEMRTLEAGSVDAVMTDAPYRHAHMDGGGFAAAEKFYANGTIDFISDFDFAMYADVLFCAPILVSFCSRDLIRDYANEAHTRGYTFDVHFWEKSNAIPFTHNTFKSDLEYIIVCKKGTHRLASCLQDEMSKAYRSGIVTGKKHPTEKPIRLMSKYIKIFGEAQTIFDPFMGSGTTGVACVKLNRNFIGCEISPMYFEIATKRIHDAQLQIPMELTC